MTTTIEKPDPKPLDKEAVVAALNAARSIIWDKIPTYSARTIAPTNEIVNDFLDAAQKLADLTEEVAKNE